MNELVSKVGIELLGHLKIIISENFLNSVFLGHSACLIAFSDIFFCIWPFLTGETNGSSVDDEVETSVKDGVCLHPDSNHSVGPHLRCLLPEWCKMLQRFALNKDAL